MLRIARTTLKHASRPSLYSAGIIHSPQSTSQSQQRRQYSAEVVGVMSAIQHSIISIHNFTHLPWWGTIALSTIGLRIGLLPLLRYQILTSRKLAAAMPDINLLYRLLQKRIHEIPPNKVNERMKVIKTFFKGVSASLAVNDVGIFQILFFPMLNISIFITFIYSVRDLVLTGPTYLDLDNGGMLWFKDLYGKDKTFILPLSAIALSYSALEVGLSGKDGSFITRLKDFFQSISVLSIPMLTGLPSGVFCYWIPNSLWSMAQSQAVKSPAFLRLLQIPPMKPTTGDENRNSSSNSSGSNSSNPTKESPPSS